LKNVIVIGGGIIGLSSAYYLQQAGHRVTVIDKNDFSDNCSYGNMGYISPSHFIPLATPGIIWQGLKWMLNSQSPFYVQPSLNKSLVNWGINFVKSATKKNVDAAAVPLKDISLLSLQEYKLWATLPGFDFAFEHKGMLEIFKTSAVADHAWHTCEKAKALGLKVEFLNAEQLQMLEPQTTIDATGAIFFMDDAHLYPNKLMTALKTHLTRNGVLLIPNEEVIRFENNGNKITKVITTKNGYDCDEVVVATGAWSRELAAMMQTKLSLMPGRGYSFTLTDSLFKLNHPAILVEGRVAITPMDGNKMRFGGTMEIVSTSKPPRYNRVNGIIKAVKSFLPEFDIIMPHSDDIWYGFRPCSADGLPYIGRIKNYKNVVIATGHAMLGLSLGPATGKLVSELINEEPGSIDLKPFTVERFK
jgi:D-amino-acid dehydrogenase